MSKRVVELVYVGVVASAVFVVGCNDPQARANVAHRTERIHMWLDYAADHEANGTRRLGETVELATRLHERQVVRFHEIPGGIGWLHAREIENWNRNTAWIAELVRKDLQGDPELVRRTAINLAF